MKVIYTATGTAVGGRAGEARSSDGELAVRLVRPKELGGPGQGGTNPEQLFACGYAACFLSTIEHIARERKIMPGRVEVTAHVGLGKREDGGFGLTATLEVAIPDASREDAQDLVEAAHRTGPYSNATRGNVDVKLTLV